ncbi:MAG TPA: hypothetical protein VK774_04225 [Solirubrobacteraceae bacterium]|jgi:hypothetical protein|nr:hypothetical protein [Solirubrobacteraceae bacterium]
MLGNQEQRRVGRKLFALTLLVAALAAVSVASPALATPKGEYAVFAQCPTTTASGCIAAKTESGEFHVGNKTVPIEKTITLQGGFNENEEGELVMVAAKDGNTLTKVPQKVPGGLSGLVNCTAIKGSGLLEKLERGSCEAIFENGLTGVTATTELAGPASAVHINLVNLLTAEGTALTLPAKVHLENPLLGSACYVGSNSSPIALPLTTGKTTPPLPNKSISGNPGTLSFNGEGTILTVSKNSLVNNSYSAPTTNGCGGIFEFLIGPIINSSLGVPSAAGHNTAILNGTLQQTSSEAVKDHE